MQARSSTRQRPLRLLQSGWKKQSPRQRVRRTCRCRSRLPCQSVEAACLLGRGPLAAEVGCSLPWIRAIWDLPQLDGTKEGGATKIHSIQWALNTTKFSFSFVRNTLLYTLCLKLCFRPTSKSDFLPASAPNSPARAPNILPFPIQALLCPREWQTGQGPHPRRLPFVDGFNKRLFESWKKMNEWIEWKERRIKHTKLNSDKLSHKNYTCSAMSGCSITPKQSVCRDYAGPSENETPTWRGSDRFPPGVTLLFRWENPKGDSSIEMPNKKKNTGLPNSSQSQFLPLTINVQLATSLSWTFFCTNKDPSVSHMTVIPKVLNQASHWADHLTP